MMECAGGDERTVSITTTIEEWFLRPLTTACDGRDSFASLSGVGIVAYAHAANATTTEVMPESATIFQRWSPDVASLRSFCAFLCMRRSEEDCRHRTTSRICE